MLNVECVIDVIRKECKERIVPEPQTFGDIQRIFNDGVYASKRLTLDMKEPFFRTVAGEPGHRVAIFCSERKLDWHKQHLIEPIGLP